MSNIVPSITYEKILDISNNTNRALSTLINHKQNLDNAKYDNKIRYWNEEVLKHTEKIFVDKLHLFINTINVEKILTSYSTIRLTTPKKWPIL